MFTVSDVPVVLRKLALRLEDDEDHEDGGPLRVVSSSFRIFILSHDLARALDGIPIARHCFTRDGLPAWDVDDVTFTPPEAHYLVTLKSAPDALAPVAAVNDATIETIRVWRRKIKTRDLSLEFVTRHVTVPGEIAHLGEWIHAWEVRSLYITLTEIRPPLFEDIDKPRPSSASTGKTH